MSASSSLLLVSAEKDDPRLRSFSSSPLKWENRTVINTVLRVSDQYKVHLKGYFTGLH